MSDFGNTILTELQGRRRPVTGTLLADLNGWPQSTTLWWLKKLEEAKLVKRPNGRKGGWLPA